MVRFPTVSTMKLIVGPHYEFQVGIAGTVEIHVGFAITYVNRVQC